MKELDAGRQEALVLDDAALERRLRSDQDMIADLDGVPACAADVEVLADDALGGDRPIVTSPQTTAVETTYAVDRYMATCFDAR